jgi:hypothetical protein
VARVEGVEALVARLNARAEQARRDAAGRVVVGYTAGYALPVHEDREAHHPVGKAGFLLDPARRLAPELKRIVAEAVKRGVPLPQALLLAGLRLQRESQAECPVDKGYLRSSAFTALE